MKNKPMINVKLSKEIVDFLQMNSNMVKVGESTYFQPAQFWYKQAYMGDNTVFSVYQELPTKQQDNA
jgi:hypothetical protein